MLRSLCLRTKGDNFSQVTSYTSCYLLQANREMRVQFYLVFTSRSKGKLGFETISHPSLSPLNCASILDACFQIGCPPEVYHCSSHIISNKAKRTEPSQLLYKYQICKNVGAERKEIHKDKGQGMNPHNSVIFNPSYYLALWLGAC